MRFLIAFACVLGYAAAGLISPLYLGATAGDIQAAHIDSAVAAQDTVRAIGEGQARAAEAAVQYNTEAVRQVAETTRDINENAYWNNVAASQNYVAAAQSQAAAINGAAAAVRGAAWNAYAGAPLGYAGIAPVLGHGLRYW